MKRLHYLIRAHYKLIRLSRELWGEYRDAVVENGNVEKMVRVAKLSDRLEDMENAAERFWQWEAE